jgi:hypothetical protein
MKRDTIEREERTGGRYVWKTTAPEERILYKAPPPTKRDSIFIL